MKLFEFYISRFQIFYIGKLLNFV